MTEENKPTDLGALKPIKSDNLAEEVIKSMGKQGFILPVVAQFEKPTKTAEILERVLTLDPEEFQSLSLEEIDRFLIVIPRGLIYLQEMYNKARAKLDDAINAYNDVIEDRAALLEKSAFDTSQITTKMRTAKIRMMYPKEFNELQFEVRRRQETVTRLTDQVKHLERLNDNIKRIRDTWVMKLQREKGVQ